MFIQRNNDIREVNRLLKILPVTAILGARQCGKTTLAKQFPYDHYFDLRLKVGVQLIFEKMVRFPKNS